MSRSVALSVSDVVPPKFRRFPFRAFFPFDVSSEQGAPKAVPLYFSDPKYYANAPEQILSHRAILIDQMAKVSARLCLVGPKGVDRNIYLVNTRDDVFTQIQALSSDNPETKDYAEKQSKQFPRRVFLVVRLSYGAPNHKKTAKEDDVPFVQSIRHQTLSLLGGRDEIWERSTELTLWKTGNVWPLMRASELSNKRTRVTWPDIAVFGDVAGLSPYKRVRAAAEAWFLYGGNESPILR